MSDSLWTHGLYSPGTSPGQNTGVGSRFLLWASSQPRDQTQASPLQVDSPPAEPPRKPACGMVSPFSEIRVSNLLPDITHSSVHPPNQGGMGGITTHAFSLLPMMREKKPTIISTCVVGSKGHYEFLEGLKCFSLNYS